MRKYILPIFLGAFLMMILGGCAKSFNLSKDLINIETDWAMARKGLNAAANMESDFNGKLDLLWAKKIGDYPIGPLSLGSNHVILSGARGKLYFVSTDSGHYNGRIKTDDPVQTGMIVIDSIGYVGIGHNENQFVALNLLNRKVLWRTPLKDVTGPPIIIDRRLYAGSAHGYVYSIDRLTGEVIWKDSVGANTLAGPSGFENMVYFPLENGTLIGYEADSGDKVFEVDLQQPLVSKVAIADHIYVTGSEGQVYAVNRMTGEIVWESSFPYPIWTAPALGGDMLVFGDNEGFLRALDASTGRLVWEFGTGGVIVASPIIVGDYVVFPSLDKNLYCVELKTGRMVSRRDLKYEIRLAPVSDGKKIFVADRRGSVQCYGNDNE